MAVPVKSFLERRSLELGLFLRLFWLGGRGRGLGRRDLELDDRGASVAVSVGHEHTASSEASAHGGSLRVTK